MFQANAGFLLNPFSQLFGRRAFSTDVVLLRKLWLKIPELPTLILDEIDSGVSGKTADEIGKVMREMAKNMQLIVITPRTVASKGDSHYKVIKKEGKKAERNLQSLIE